MYCFYNILPLTDVKHYIFGIILLLYNNGGFIIICCFVEFTTYRFKCITVINVKKEFWNSSHNNNKNTKKKVKTKIKTNSLYLIQNQAKRIQ